jgi:hypothetical protein
MHISHAPITCSNRYTSRTSELLSYPETPSVNKSLTSTRMANRTSSEAVATIVFCLYLRVRHYGGARCQVVNGIVSRTTRFRHQNFQPRQRALAFMSLAM